MTPRKKAPHTPLSRERIVAAALGIVDREGPAGLSMRTLGHELGVDPMAAYYYVPSKDALLDAIVEAVMAEIDLSADDPAAPAEERILAAAVAYRDALLAHVKALPIVLTRPPATLAALRPVERLVGILCDAGLLLREAVAGMSMVGAAVRGFVGMVDLAAEGASSSEKRDGLVRQLSAEEFPHLRNAPQRPPGFLGADFEFGIRALARGLLAEAARRGGEAPSAGPAGR